MCGSLESPPEGGDFSYRESLARQGVYSRLTSYTSPNQLLSRAGSGVDSDLPPALSEVFKVTGTAYILAISGNITIIVF